MKLDSLDERISKQNREKIVNSGLLLEESVNYAVEQCNLLFSDWLDSRNNLDEANDVVAGFLDGYYLKPQLDYEIYTKIWPNLTDEDFLDDFVNSLSNQDKLILENSKNLINPSLYNLFVKSLNFHYLKTKENVKRFKNKLVEKPLNFTNYINVFNSFEDSYLKDSFGMTLWQVKQLKDWEKEPPLDLTKVEYIFFVNSKFEHQ